MQLADQQANRNEKLDNGIVWTCEATTWRYLYIAPEAERVLGYGVAAWLESALFWLGRVHPEDVARVMAVVQGGGEEKRPFSLSYRWQLANGRWVWIDDQIHPLPGQQQLLGVKHVRACADGQTAVTPAEAIAFLNQTLFVQGTFRERLAESLQVVGKALSLTAIYILENQGEDGGGQVVGRYAWEGEKTAVLPAPVWEQADYEMLELDDYLVQLSEGDMVLATLPWPGTRQQLTAVVVPIMYQTRWQGSVLCYADAPERQWLPVELEAIITVAKLLSAAFRNVRSYEQTRQQLSQTAEQLQAAEALNEIATYLNSTLELDAVLQRTVDVLRRYLTNVQSCSLTILEENGTVMRMRAQWVEQSAYSILAVGQQRIIAHSNFSLQAITSRKPVIIPDFQADPQAYKTSQPLVERGLRSILYVPIISHDEPIGLLHVNAWGEPRHFTPEEVVLCQSVANQAALAIDNARLFVAAQQQLDQRNALLRATTAMSTSLDRQTILLRLASQMAQVTHASSTYVVQRDYEQGCWQVLAEYKQADVVEQRLPSSLRAFLWAEKTVDDKMLAQFAQKKAYIFYEDDLALLPWQQEFMQKRALKSFLGVPLFVEGEFWGLVAVWDTRRRRAFTDADVALCFGITQQAGVAIERTNLYAQLQEYADHLAEEVAARTAELQAERDRTLAILDSAGEGILLTNVNAEILYVNPTMEQQTGYLRTELLGENPRILGSGQVKTAVFREMWDTILRGERWSGALVNQRKDGTFYDISMTITPTRGFDGEISGFVGVQADISRLKEIDRLKSEFVSNVSHELRTPLTNIKTYLALVERGREEKRAHYLKVLNQESDRLGRLIQDLLDLSRLETEALPERIEPTDFKRQLFKQIDAFAVKANSKHISVRVDLEDGLPLLRMAENHLGQLLTNLFGNSISYLQPHGSVQIAARSLKVGSGQRMVLIRFADDGPGIPLEEQGRIFERFYRGKGVRNQGVPGTGLGLAICKEIVERYGGTIVLDGQVTQGAAFLVRLPAVV